MEAAHMFHIVFIDRELVDIPVFIDFKLSDPVVDIIIVVGIVLEGVDFVCKTVFQRLAEIHI